MQNLQQRAHYAEWFVEMKSGTICSSYLACTANTDLAHASDFSKRPSISLVQNTSCLLEMFVQNSYRCSGWWLLVIRCSETFSICELCFMSPKRPTHCAFPCRSTATEVTTRTLTCTISGRWETKFAIILRVRSETLGAYFAMTHTQYLCMYVCMSYRKVRS